MLMMRMQKIYPTGKFAYLVLFCVQVNLNPKTRLDISTLVEYEIENFLVSETQGIEKCFIKEDNVNGQERLVLVTQGINIQVDLGLNLLKAAIILLYFINIFIFYIYYSY